MAAFLSMGIRTWFFHFMIKLIKFYLSYLVIKVTDFCSPKSLHCKPYIFQLIEKLIKSVPRVFSQSRYPYNHISLDLGFANEHIFHSYNLSYFKM